MERDIRAVFQRFKDGLRPFSMSEGAYVSCPDKSTALGADKKLIMAKITIDCRNLREYGTMQIT